MGTTQMQSANIDDRAQVSQIRKSVEVLDARHAVRAETDGQLTVAVAALGPSCAPRRTVRSWRSAQWPHWASRPTAPQCDGTAEAHASHGCFPGDMFVELRSGTDDLPRIRSLPGVSYVLPRGLPPVVLPETFIALLRQRELLGTRRLKPGDRVIVLTEPFRSIEAVFDRRLNTVGRVRVLLQLVHRGVWLNVDETSLQRRDEATSPRATGVEDCTARRLPHSAWPLPSG